jgi:hypothetical protein
LQATSNVDKGGYTTAMVASARRLQRIDRDLSPDRMANKVLTPIEASRENMHASLHYAGSLPYHVMIQERALPVRDYKVDLSF